MDLLNATYDSFRAYEIKQIIFLQQHFFQYEWILNAVTDLFNAKMLWTFMIPMFAAFSTKLHINLVLSCLASECTTIMLKWVIAEDRPYWWVNTTPVYTTLTRPILYQTVRTCESSAGSPSGHTGLSSAFLFALLYGIEKTLYSHNLHKYNTLKYFFRAIFMLIIATVTVSRMYFATHFLHQCLIGFLICCWIAKRICTNRNNELVLNFSRKKWFLIHLSSLIVMLLFYWTYKLLVRDPQWSVQLAFNHCHDPHYLDPDSTQMFGWVRAMGFLFGIVLSASLKERFSGRSNLRLFISIPLTITLIVLRFYAVLYTPKAFKINVYYAYTFVVNAFFLFSFLYLVPKLSTKKIQTKTE